MSAPHTALRDASNWLRQCPPLSRECDTSNNPEDRQFLGPLSHGLTSFYCGTMECLGTAASVIAVIELSAKVSSLCYKYYTAVNNAKNDIDRLCEELGQLKSTLEGACRLLEGPHAARLKTSQPLHDGVSSSSSRLTELQAKLEKKLQLGTRQKIMSRVGRSTLK